MKYSKLFQDLIYTSMMTCCAFLYRKSSFLKFLFFIRDKIHVKKTVTGKSIRFGHWEYIYIYIYMLIFTLSNVLGEGGVPEVIAPQLCLRQVLYFWNFPDLRPLPYTFTCVKIP